MSDTDNATNMTSKRNALFQDMPPALQKVAKDFETKFKKKARMLCLSAYDMGTKIRQVIEEEAHYGSNAVEQLAEYLGKGTTTLYELQTFAGSFTREFVDETASEPMANGEFVNPEHFYTMMKLTDLRMANKLWKSVKELSWSAAQLYSEVSPMTGKSEVRRGGSRPKRPVSPAAGLESIRRNAQKLRNLIPVVCDASCDAIDEMAPVDINAKLVETITTARDEAIELRTSVDMILERLEDNLERAERVLEAKKSLTGDEDSNDDEEDETVAEVEGEEDSEEEEEKDEGETFDEFEEEEDEAPVTPKEEDQSAYQEEDEVLQDAEGLFSSQDGDR